MPLGSAPLEGAGGSRMGQRRSGAVVVLKASADPVGSSGVQMSPPHCPAVGHNGWAFLFPHPYVRASVAVRTVGEAALSG